MTVQKENKKNVLYYIEDTIILKKSQNFSTRLHSNPFVPKIFKQSIKLIQWTWARAELHRTMESHTDMYCQQLM